MPCPTVEAQKVEVSDGDHHVAGTPILRGRETALASEVGFAATGANATDAPRAWNWLNRCDIAVVVVLGVMCPRSIGVIRTGRDVCPDVKSAVPSYF